VPFHYRTRAVLVCLHIVASFLLQLIPIHLALRLVEWGTPIVLLFARGYVQRATMNMHQVLGPLALPDEVERLTAAAFSNYARYMLDLVRLPSLEPHELSTGVQFQGWEHLEEAFRRGHGVVLVTGHIGNWDLAGAVLVARGKPVSALVETLKPPRWNERVQRIRQQAGVRAIPIESGVRDMLAALRRNEGLAVLIDRPLAEEGVPVTFFGRTTRIPGGAATLAQRTGAAVVPAVFVRDPAGRGYIAHIGEPIMVEKNGQRAREVQAVTQRLMTWLEGMIRQYPDQWYMFRQMWPVVEAPQPVLAPAEAAP
jgi:lauroyl/myristoyl acyltransferase